MMSYRAPARSPNQIHICVYIDVCMYAWSLLILVMDYSTILWNELLVLEVGLDLWIQVSVQWFLTIQCHWFLCTSIGIFLMEMLANTFLALWMAWKCAIWFHSVPWFKLVPNTCLSLPFQIRSCSDDYRDSCIIWFTHEMKILWLCMVDNHCNNLCCFRRISSYLYLCPRVEMMLTLSCDSPFWIDLSFVMMGSADSCRVAFVIWLLPSFEYLRFSIRPHVSKWLTLLFFPFQWIDHCQHPCGLKHFGNLSCSTNGLLSLEAWYLRDEFDTIFP
jgi:hypothetical protein